MISPVIFASMIVAGIGAGLLHMLGVRWPWAFALSSIVAFAIGWSVADSIGINLLFKGAP